MSVDAGRSVDQTFACGWCARSFTIRFLDLVGNSRLFCPYCGVSLGRGSFLETCGNAGPELDPRVTQPPLGSGAKPV